MGCYYRKEEYNQMTKTIEYWKKRGMNCYSIFPCDNGWILNLNLMNIFWDNKIENNNIKEGAK